MQRGFEIEGFVFDQKLLHEKEQEVTFWPDTARGKTNRINRGRNLTPHFKTTCMILTGVARAKAL